MKKNIKRKIIIILAGCVIGTVIGTAIAKRNAHREEPVDADILAKTEAGHDPDQNVILEDEKSEIDIQDKAAEEEQKANADSGSAPGTSISVSCERDNRGE